MEIAVKFVGIIAGIFTLYKVIVDVVLAKSMKRRDEYAFTKDFLCDLEKELIHPLIVEKGFLALSGIVLEEPEIRYIMSQDNPSTLIELRRDVSSFLQFNVSNLHYEWNGKYKRYIWQKHGSKIYICTYSMLAFIGLVPLLMDNSQYLTNIPVMIFCVSLLFTAICSLAKHENIKRADKFMAGRNA